MGIDAVLSEAGLDSVRLAAWMNRQDLGAGPIAGARRLSGGTQNILLRFERAGRTYVLRRPPANPRPESNQTMLREARVLSALAKESVPHARLIAASADVNEFGFAFYLMEPVDGFNATEDLPPLAQDAAARRAMGLSLVDALAALGRVDAAAVGLGDFGKPEGFLERQAGRWKAQLDGYAKFDGWHGPASLPDVGGVAEWLDANRPSSFVPGIQHGDFHLGNIMFSNRGPEVAAIVDWELATLGDPLLDLGWLLATWPDSEGRGGAFDIQPWSGFPKADEIIAHYSKSSARSLEAIGWYEVLACFKLGILQEGTMARAQAGLVPMESGAHLHRLAVQMFERAHQRIAEQRPSNGVASTSEPEAIEEAQ